MESLGDRTTQEQKERRSYQKRQLCPILGCSKRLRGNIGLSLHLKYSHSHEELAKLYLSRIMDILPFLFAFLVIRGAKMLIENAHAEHI